MMRPRFTNAGRALHLRALAGVQITFTKMQLGDGSLGETDYQTLTALISPKATLSLSGIKVADGSATVRGEFNNANMIEGFYYRELGLFAQDPDNPTQEILYCYANFGDECQYIAEPSSAQISRTVRIVATVDDAPNVTAVLNDNAQYVDYDEMMLAIEQHNQSEAAHQNLMDFDVTYYVDSTTQEDADDRDGTQTHPFMTIQEAADAIPLSALRVCIYLKTGGATYAGLDDDYSFSGFQRVEIRYDGEQNTRPIVAGHLRFDRCSTVLVRNLSFTAAASTTLEVIDYLAFTDCGQANVLYARGTLLDGLGAFVKSIRSSVSIREMECIGANVAVNAYDNSAVVVCESTITGGTMGLVAGGAARIYVGDAAYMTNTATIPVIAVSGGMIMDALTQKDITNGTVYTHVHSESNPHNVSLTQAQNKGGVINTPHGGTGKTRFDDGALLKGAGSGPVAQLLGVGALYADALGEPQFGTLPVSMGGTGRTNSGTYVQSTPTNGVLHGSAIIPGTNIVIMWGKINTGGNTTYNHNFTQYNGAKFANDNYVLTFSGQDDVWGSITKSTTGFSIDVGGIAAGSYVADWIAIGIVDET